MPSSRAKACKECRAAKAGCSLSSPCARCATRGLNCQYSVGECEDRPPPRVRALQPARPWPPSFPKAAEDQAAPTVTVTHTTRNDLPEDRITTTTSTLKQTDGLLDAASIHDAAVPPPLGIEIPTDFMPELLSLPNTFDLSPFSFGRDVPLARETQLKQRSRSLQEGDLTAKLLFSKLVEYSRMMAEAIRLPPFIHPPCWLGRIARCDERAPHRCLPEGLAVCSNLAQMFYLRRQGSEGFVWQQICDHLRQLRVKVHLPMRALSDLLH